MYEPPNFSIFFLNSSFSTFENPDTHTDNPFKKSELEFDFLLL